MAQAIFTQGKKEALKAIFNQYNYLALGYSSDITSSFDPNDPLKGDGQTFNELKSTVNYSRVTFTTIDNATITVNDDNTVTMTLQADFDTSNITDSTSINQFAICKNASQDSTTVDDIYCAGNFTEFVKDSTTGLTFVIEIFL